MFTKCEIVIFTMPPVPDMSMPFNVISLSCILYAFVIGSLANLLIRKSSQRIKSKMYPNKRKSKIQRIKERVNEKLGRFKKSKAGEEETSTNGAAVLSENASVVEEES